MGWNQPRTFTAGEIITASILNTHLRDQLRFLKGLDGTVVLSDGLNLGANELTINSLETVGVDGIVNKEQVEDHTHQDAANCGQLDHGLALTGLTDDDHTQYQLKSLLTTQGDIIYATAASTWARLAKGTAYQALRMNSGATAPEWASGEATKILKTSDQTTTTAGTFKDTQLSLPVGANEVWSIFLYLWWQMPSGYTVKVYVTVPTGGASQMTNSGNLAKYMTPETGDEGSYGSGTDANALTLFWGRYVGGGTAGNVQLTWSTTNAITISMRANSYIIAHKLS